MGKVERFATFKADLPDDSVERDGEIVVPGGRNIVEDICDRLRESGHEPTRPQQHSFYGWSFELQVDGLRAFVLLQSPEDWLLIVEVHGGVLTSRGRMSAALTRTVEALETAMTANARIAARTWMTREAYEASAPAG